MTGVWGEDRAGGAFSFISTNNHPSPSCIAVNVTVGDALEFPLSSSSTEETNRPASEGGEGNFDGGRRGYRMFSGGGGEDSFGSLNCQR